MWGLTDIDFQLLPTKDSMGLVCKARFSYLNDGVVSSFPIAADMAYDPSKDCVKKLQTECISKALSRLGFNSDVFEGKFDDNKYVEEREREEANNVRTVKSGNNPARVDPVPASNEVSQASAKEKKIPDPNPVESGIMAKLAQKYMEKLDKGYVVDFKTMCTLVYEKYGKYPQNEASIQLVLGNIPVSSVQTKNDFLDGV